MQSLCSDRRAAGHVLLRVRLPARMLAVLRNLPPLVREASLIVGLWVLYQLARVAVDIDVPGAMTRAGELLHVETLLRLDIEAGASQALSALPVLAVVASWWYAALHYLVTPAVMIWLYRQRPEHYRAWRWALVVATAVAMVCYWLIPAAPPRLFGAGHLDVLADYTHWGWWGADASAPRGLGGWTNEYAAMPSLHVGWAVWCALVVSHEARHRWVRRLAWIYPAGTSFVVIGTGNHWVLDVVAGAALVLLSTAIVAPHVARRTAPARAVAPC